VVKIFAAKGSDESLTKGCDIGVYGTALIVSVPSILKMDEEYQQILHGRAG